MGEASKAGGGIITLIGLICTVIGIFNKDIGLSGIGGIIALVGRLISEYRLFG